MTPVSDLVANFTKFVIQPAADILFAAGFFIFVWGLIEFLRSINEGKDSNEGKMHMLWGVLGMLIMVSVVGILALLSGTFGLGLNQTGDGNFNYNPDTGAMNRAAGSMNVGNLFKGK